MLLNYGADITLCNSKGESVLDFAPDSMRPLLLGMLNRLKHLFGWRWGGQGRQWTKDSECPQYPISPSIIKPQVASMNFKILKLVFGKFPLA